MNWRRFAIRLGVAVGLSLQPLLYSGNVLACSNEQSCSTNYGVSQTFFGAGGNVNACSTSYCSKQSLGEIGIGNPSSTNYQAHGGFNTSSRPYLYFVVNSSSINLGVLSTTSTATTTGTFTVRTYNAGGYVVQTDSPPPTTAGHVLSPITTAAASQTGTEQFGINLVQNTTACGAPTNFGANPVDNPDSGAAVGIAAPGYNTCGKFQYNNGDTIAESNSPGNTTGEADYTISFIYNISSGTPAGTYIFNDVLVVTPTY